MVKIVTIVAAVLALSSVTFGCDCGQGLNDIIRASTIVSQACGEHNSGSAKSAFSNLENVVQRVCNNAVPVRGRFLEKVSEIRTRVGEGDWNRCAQAAQQLTSIAGDYGRSSACCGRDCGINEGPWSN
ncbi:hypothetical protein BDA99DRAFT_66576 [Phascolomyces articulosus]|uniref:Uncharacterized protein n=1 Tax=Phascolomyces articulosus TaxID=60185 RepID=A0AAD5K0N2_9FUNG|nr:hypothetical protein BDA99DRAFT_66576 [Phascolomyces articulosus]